VVDSAALDEAGIACSCFLFFFFFATGGGGRWRWVKIVRHTGLDGLGSSRRGELKLDGESFGS